MHDDDGGQSDRQQVILDTVTLPVAEPVDEKTKLPVNLEHGDNHRSGNAERGDAAQESDDQAEAAEELRGDRKIRERNGNSELIVESTDGRAQTMTAEPTEKFLRAVRKKNYAKDHAR